MSPAKTPAERQRKFRARKAEQQAPELRGIFAHPEDQKLIKAYAAKLQSKRAKAAKSAPTRDGLAQLLKDKR